MRKETLEEEGGERIRATPGSRSQAATVSQRDRRSSESKTYRKKVKSPGAKG